MPVLVFPDVEAQQIAYLKAALTARGEGDVWVGNRLPAAIPPRAVLVRDDGGPRLDVVRGVARMGFRVWDGGDAMNPAESSDLANLCASLVSACADGLPVVRANASRPYSVEDPSGRPTHYFTAELVVRGTQL